MCYGNKCKFHLIISPFKPKYKQTLFLEATINCIWTDKIMDYLAAYVIVYLIFLVLIYFKTGAMFLFVLQWVRYNPRYVWLTKCCTTCCPSIGATDRKQQLQPKKTTALNTQKFSAFLISHFISVQLFTLTPIAKVKGQSTPSISGDSLWDCFLQAKMTSKGCKTDWKHPVSSVLTTVSNLKCWVMLLLSQQPAWEVDQ